MQGPPVCCRQCPTLILEGTLSRARAHPGPLQACPPQTPDRARWTSGRRKGQWRMTAAHCRTAGRRSGPACSCPPLVITPAVGRFSGPPASRSALLLLHCCCVARRGAAGFPRLRPVLGAKRAGRPGARTRSYARPWSGGVQPRRKAALPTQLLAAAPQRAAAPRAHPRHVEAPPRTLHSTQHSWPGRAPGTLDDHVHSSAGLWAAARAGCHPRGAAGGGVTRRHLGGDAQATPARSLPSTRALPLKTTADAATCCIAWQ
jgi:hypothetical protein